jgi:hypothetical protein
MKGGDTGEGYGSIYPLSPIEGSGGYIIDKHSADGNG